MKTKDKRQKKRKQINKTEKRKPGKIGKKNENTHQPN
jgi:hypothetical protein